MVDLAVISIWIDRLVLVEARDGTHRLLLHVLCLELSVLGVVLMAIDDDRRHSIVLMIMSHVDIRSCRSLRMIMVVPSAVGLENS